MNLFSTLQVYGGGPGSGCNPAVGTCGRHPGSGAGATELRRAFNRTPSGQGRLLFPQKTVVPAAPAPKAKKWRQFNPKNVGGYFRKETQIAKMYETLAGKNGEWHKISDFQNQYAGSKFADVMERLTNIRRVGKRSGLWEMEIDRRNDRVRILVSGKQVPDQEVRPQSIQPPKMDAPSSDTSGVEKRLMEGAVVSQKGIGGDHGNQTYVVKLDNGQKAVWKPGTNGELYMRGVPFRQNIDPGKAIEREVGAYEVAKIVGMTDLVPPSVKREINGERGVMMQFVKGDIAANTYDPKQTYDGEDNQARAAVFDYVIGNEDRHMGNWLVDGDKLHLIDHGLSFPEREESFRANGGSNARFLVKVQERDKDTPSVWAAPYEERKEMIAEKLSQVGLRPDSIVGVLRRIDKVSNVDTKWSQLRKVKQW